jgi:subfamily B ATP-binding cassette protein MsbA
MRRSDRKSIVLKALGFLKKYLSWLIVGQVAIIISVGLNMLIPWVTKDLFDTMIRQDDLKSLNYLILGLFVVFLLQALISFVRSYSLSIVGHNVAKDMRVATYSKIQELSMDFFERNRLGDLVSRLTNDINLVQGTLTGGITSLVSQVISLIAGILLLFSLDVRLTLVTMITLPLVIYFSKILGNKMRSVSREVQRQLGLITSFIQETLSGVSTIKAFRLEGYVKEEFSNNNSIILNVSLDGDKYRAKMGSLISFLNDLALLAVMGYGAYRVMSGHMSAGELIAFILYIGNITGPISGLIGVYADAQRALSAGERVFEVLEATPRVEDPPVPALISELKGQVEFSRVSFSYDNGKEILKDVSFKINPGEMVALVGMSGAGKSTIAKLIPRFYDISEGAIFIDGVNIKDIPQATLRDAIGIVPQDPYLFAVSIRDNIACGKIDATDEEIITAAKEANAHEFITQLDKGYLTEAGEKGTKLSGGQKQRIAIARAILKNPKILILDEATSSLDTISERAVQDALTRILSTRSTLVIAHRLSTVKNADRILLLDNGQIVESGTHQELLASGGLYTHLYGTGYFIEEESHSS